jgi:hypothetical protein
MNFQSLENQIMQTSNDWKFEDGMRGVELFRGLRECCAATRNKAHEPVIGEAI